MEKSGNTKKIIQYVAIGVMLLLIIAVVAVMLLIKDKQESEKEPETTTHVDTYEEIVGKGDTFLAAGEYDKAVEEYLKALEMDKKADLMLKIADIHLKEEEYGKVLSYLYEILDITKDDKSSDIRKEAYTSIFNIYLDAEDNDAAYRLIEIASQDFDGIFENYLSEGKVTSPKVNPYEAEAGYVYFGEYPQDMIKAEDVPDYIKNAKYDENGTACIYGRKYAKVGDSYFSYKPIKWEILVDNGGSYILMTDMLLDCEKYMEKMEDSSWDVSHLRTWLNTTYSGIAFDSEEHALIQKTLVTRPENYFYSTFNGADSEDYVVVLSCRSLVNSQYGLRDEEQDRRVAYATDYAVAKGLFADEEGRGKWWTSSNGSNNKSYVFVNYDGVISAGGELATNSKIGVRPVITVNK